MAKAAEIRRLVRPFVKARSGLAIVKRTIIVTPVSFGVRGVCFPASSSYESLDPTPLAWPTFHYGDLTFGTTLAYRRPDNRAYEYTDDDIQEILFRLLDDIALPELFEIVTPDEYLKFNRKDGPLMGVFSIFLSIFTHICLGDFATAARHHTSRWNWPFHLRGGDPDGPRIRVTFTKDGKTIRDAHTLALEEKLNRQKPMSYHIMDRYAPGLMERFADEGDAMSDDNKRALVAALRRLEHDNIVRAGLEPYWQKAEWPVEAMLGMA